MGDEPTCPSVHSHCASALSRPYFHCGEALRGLKRTLTFWVGRRERRLFANETFPGWARLGHGLHKVISNSFSSFSETSLA